MVSTDRHLGVTTERFWDEVYSEDSLPKLKPHIEKAVLSGMAFFGDMRGKRVLDLGCGTGGATFLLGSFGADVTGIDISSVAVEQLNREASLAGASNVRAVVCGAFDIYRLEQFDFVFGSMILHHIEPFSDFVDVLRRTLKPAGKAFFYENNSASDLLVWFRRHVVGRLWVPKHGDDDEFPLAPAEVKMLERHFKVEVEIPEMFFVRLVSAYLLKGRLNGLAKGIDSFLFRINVGKRYSYRQYVKIQG